jgi:hypothetical protein
MMPAMRPGAPVLAAVLALAATVPLQADEWTLIDVKARLANDGRATVVETHHIVLETTGRNVFHDFGRGADQDIRLTAMTRIGPDGEPHPLKKVETVTGPDEYAYYERGHAYFSIPPLGEKVSVQYRFEYELIGAVAPAWAIAAGPGSRAPSDQELFFPWERIGHIVADWRIGWPKLATRYRFDHDVLLPDREGPGHTFRQIDYRLEFDTAWRDIAPSQDVGNATHGAFRTAKIFDYLTPGRPEHTSTTPAAMRIASLLALPVLGTLGWGLVVVAARFRRGPPIDRTFVDTKFLVRAPEEIAFLIDDQRPVVGDMLARLAGESAITIHADRPLGHTFEGSDDDGEYRLHMRRVAPDATLTGFERDVLDDIFGDARELTTESHRQRHAGRDYRPDDVVEQRLREATRARAGANPGATAKGVARWSPARVGLMIVFAAGLFGVLRNVGPLFDVVPIIGIWIFFTLALVNAWPTGWWYPGRPVRGLLVSLVLLYAMQLTMLLMPNRPLPAEGWAASAIAVLAGYFLTLVRARMPGGHGGVIADLLRMRAYAHDELQRPRPELDDRWIPRLRALGLGRAIEAWRARFSGAQAMPPEHGDRPRITTAHFTGVSPAPWAGPKGWASALTVYDDSDYADDEDEDDHADADGGSGNRS